MVYISPIATFCVNEKPCINCAVLSFSFKIKHLKFLIYLTSVCLEEYVGIILLFYKSEFIFLKTKENITNIDSVHAYVSVDKIEV